MWTELAAGTVAGIGTMTYATVAPSAQIFGRCLVRGAAAPTGSKRVAITFDDGPSETTPHILDLLSEHGASATFFQVGANVRRLPNVARDVADRGHIIGNHTYSHPYLYLH